ncbi:hypothetical protein N657DRAFT_300210 [Parathielavia appendiculata]|uniref:Uncharacterized protein n=1 Tax=Parathielavia appendiculata TaxID=2587402 RepID=A0AAN6U4G0_9PEZI|nr:hypothetical protein N657DRAFT_300210 [Parathielavia appendiculata]
MGRFALDHQMQPTKADLPRTTCDPCKKKTADRQCDMAVSRLRIPDVHAVPVTVSSSRMRKMQPHKHSISGWPFPGLRGATHAAGKKRKSGPPRIAPWTSRYIAYLGTPQCDNAPYRQSGSQWTMDLGAIAAGLAGKAYTISADRGRRVTRQLQALSLRLLDRVR